MILRPQIGRTFICAAQFQCHFIAFPDAFAIICQKRNHMAVAGRSRFAVVWLADYNQRPWPVTRHPACPEIFGFSKFELEPKNLKNGGIEGKSLAEIRNTKMNV